MRPWACMIWLGGFCWILGLRRMGFITLSAFFVSPPSVGLPDTQMSKPRVCCLVILLYARLSVAGPLTVKLPRPVRWRVLRQTF